MIVCIRVCIQFSVIIVTNAAYISLAGIHISIAKASACLQGVGE